MYTSVYKRPKKGYLYLGLLAFDIASLTILDTEFLFLFCSFNGCPDLCWHRTGHSLRKSKRAENENKNYKSKLVSGILKICANFEALGWNISSNTNP